MKKSKRYNKDSRGSANPPKKQNKARYTTDAFQNVLARLGAGMPNLLEGTDYPITRLTQNFQLMNSLYRSHWIVRKIIDCIPEDMVKNWISIKTQMEPEDLKRLDKLQRTTRVPRDILQGLKWGRLYGGAAAVIIIEGHENILDEPLDYDTIMPGSFKGLIIGDRWTGITPGSEIITDVTSPDFGLPAYYEWCTDDFSVRVHNSRVLRFIGREMPPIERYTEQQWGASEIEVIFDELKKRDNTSWNIAQLIFLANLRVLKMSDLGEILAIGDEKAQKELYDTIQAQNWLMSNMGMYLLNKDDDFQTHQYAFSGLNDIYESFMLDVSGAADIPVTKLFGRSPAGFNATGESDMQNYYDMIEQKQTSQLEPVLDKLLPIMFISEFGAIPDDLDYVFNPISTPAESDLADIVEKKSNAIINVFSAGIISQKTALKELRQMSDTTNMFTNITDEDIENADDSADSMGDMPPNEEDNPLNFKLPSSDILPAFDGGEGSGNFGHEGRPGKIGGSGEGDSGSEAEKDCKLKHCGKETQKTYDKCRSNEKKITPVMNDIAKALSAKMYGLEYSVKTASSVEDKLARKKKMGISEKEAIESMGDIVRYTQLCPHNKIAENTRKTIELLTKKGYDIVEVDNKYLNKSSDYKGVHINAISPEGQKFELQIHSKESMDVKNKIHPLYEEYRNVNTSEKRKEELEREMKELSSKISDPEGIENIKNFRKG